MIRYRLWTTSLLTDQSFPVNRSDCGIPEFMDANPSFTEWWAAKRQYLAIAFPYWRFAWKQEGDRG